MLVHKAYKYRIYPNEEQKVLINKTIGSARFVYNYFLELWNNEYKNTGKGLSYSKCSALLPSLKRSEDTNFLLEVDSIALQSSVRDLDTAFKNMFNKHNNKPVFKSKNRSKLSYTTKMTNNNIVLNKKTIKLPKLGLVKFSNSRKIKGRILSSTITLRPNGNYYISVLVEEKVKPLAETNSNIGIDLGLLNYLTLSDGTIIENYKFAKKLEKNLAKEQRKLANKRLIALKKGVKLTEAKNYQKQRVEVAKLYDKILNQRNDFLHKLSTNIIKNHDIICIEDLNVKGLMKNKNLSKSIGDVSWSNFISMLKYKAEWYDKKIVEIDRYYPSSKTCSNCSNVKSNLKLSERTYNCEKCNVSIDRDLNAAINIKKEGLRIAFL